VAFIDDRCRHRDRPRIGPDPPKHATLKEELQINVELASPGHFISQLAGWKDRSQFIAREGKIEYFHYDFYAQALSRLERSHARDLGDARAMLERGLIDPARLLAFYEAIEAQLFRYPAVDPKSFRKAVEQFIRETAP
jgi:hypothetical protein